MENGKDLTLFGVYTTPSWETIGARIKHYIEGPLQQDGLYAVSVFRKILGEHFFTDGGHNHPLQSKWSNIVRWQVAQLCEWAGALEKLQHSPADITYLSELLRNRDKCQQEGLHFLRIAASLVRLGFQLRFIRSNNESKSPDIEVLEPDSGATFYIEVTHLEMNDQLKQDYDTFQIIATVCLRCAPFLLDYVQILRSLNKHELEGAIALIEDTVRKVYDSNKLQEAKNDVIEIAFAPEADMQAFETWLQVKNKRKGIYGLPVNTDETIRIAQRGRIERKVKQFPPGATGILYMGVEYLFFMNMDRRKVVAEIKQAMAAHTHLKGIVLWCDVFDPQESIHRELTDGEDLYSVHCVDGHSTMYLYCVNDQYEGNVSLSILHQFRNSLIPRLP